MKNKTLKIVLISLVILLIPVSITVLVVLLSMPSTYKLDLGIQGLESAGNVELIVNDAEYNAPMDIKANEKVEISFDSTGYDFTGWINAKGETVLTETISFKMNDNHSYTLVVDLAEFALTLNGTSALFKYGADLGDLADKPETGEVFEGWKKTDDDTVYTEALFDVSEENLVLTPYYEVISYQIVLGDQPVQTFEHGAEILDGNNIPEEGKKFLRWEHNGEEIELAKFGITYDEISLTPVYSDPVNYTVKYTSDGTTEILTEETLAFGADLDDGSTLVPSEGFVFAGWKQVDSEAVQKTAKFGVDNLAITMVPVYEIIKYEITLGDAPAQTYEFGTALPVASEEVEGKIFKGWKQDLEEDFVTHAKFGVDTLEITLIPVYEDKIFTVIYNYKEYSSGIKDVVTTKENVKYGSALAAGISFSQKVYENGDSGNYYGFMGWKKAGVDGYVTELNFENNSTTTLTAEYKYYYEKIKISIDKGESNITVTSISLSDVPADDATTVFDEIGYEQGNAFKVYCIYSYDGMNYSFEIESAMTIGEMIETFERESLTTINADTTLNIVII